VPLYPLCKVSSDQIKATAPQWAARIRKAAELPEDVRQNLLALLGGFIVHSIKNLTLEEVNKMFGDFQMEDTQVGKELIAMGRLQTQREYLNDRLSTRFKPVEKVWLDQLNAINNSMALKTIYRAVLQAKSRKQVKAAFDAALGNGQKSN